MFEKLYMHTHECAFHSSLRTHLVQIDCIHAALGRMEERIRCPSHEKTLALIHLFISLAYSMWVLSWQLTLTVLTQVHVWVMTHANKLLACLGKRICVPIGGGAHDCMKGSSVYYRCHKRRWRCSMRNVMAEEDNQKALSQLFFFVRADLICRNAEYVVGRTRDMGWESTLLIHSNLSDLRVLYNGPFSLIFTSQEN